MHPNQLELDAALAASLMYDHSELTIDDAHNAWQLQQEEEATYRNYLLADEELAKELQDMEGYPQISVNDDENYAKSLQEEEFLREDVNQITHEFQSLEVHNDNIQHQDNSESLPPNADIDLENMTYEELNELGDSIGHVNQGLSKEEIRNLPTSKFGEVSREKDKILGSNTMCSICQIEYDQDDMVSTLPCKHIYHKECISIWLAKKNTCSTCNAEVAGSSANAR